MTLGLPPSQHRVTQFSYELRALRVGRVLLDLVPRHADLIQILHQRFGEIVTNDELIRGRYGANEPDNAYDMIRRDLWFLRRLLDAAGSRWEIVTEHGKGLRLRDIPRPPGYGRGGRVSPSLM